MRVVMDVFSGRPNPQWQLTPAEARELRDRLAARPSVPLAMPPPILGLRGFVVEAEIADGPLPYALPSRFSIPAPAPPIETPSLPQAKVRRHAAAAREARPTVTAQDDAGIAAWLLQTAAGRVEDKVLETLHRSTIEARPARKTKAKTSAVAKHALAPTAPALEGVACDPFLTPFNFAFWEYVPVRLNNNCYNYATNYASNTVAQPGRRAGRQYQAFGCADVRAAAMADGCLDACEGKVRVVALAIWPGVDFHWWRMHPGGMWAHKLGVTDVWTIDNIGRLIGNGLTPETCDRGPYSLFCGFLYVPLGTTVV